MIRLTLRGCNCTAVVALSLVLQGCASQELVYKGKPTDYWMTQLTDRYWGYRLEAIQALSAMGEHDARVVQALGFCLSDSEGEVRKAARQALLGATPYSLSILSGALNDPRDYVRSEAAAALGWLGKEALTAVPALERALKDDNANVREAASTALSRIQGAEQ